MSNVRRKIQYITYKVILFLMVVLFTMPNTIRAQQDIEIDSRSLLLENEWINSYGVAVYYHFVYTPDTRFTSIELPIRLYSTRLGYPTNWGVTSAEEMRKKIESGFEDLQFFPNGQTQSPRKGDIMLWHDRAAIINSIDNAMVEVVQQQRWTQDDSSGVPLPKETYPISFTNGIYSLGSDVLGWIYSPRMQKLLDGQFVSVGIAGDWNGDGIDTIGVYNPALSTFYLRNTNTEGRPDLIVTFGEPGKKWIPIAGDWNGDGIDTIGVYDADTSTYFLRNSNTSGPADISFVFGTPSSTNIPVAGDWNKDAVDSVGFYDRNRAVFFLRNDNNALSSNIAVAYGRVGNTYVPLIGDWQGREFDSIGLFVPSENLFLLRNSVTMGNADIQFSYDDTSRQWYPLVGDWNGDHIDTTGLYLVGKNNAGETYVFLLTDDVTNPTTYRNIWYSLNFIIFLPLWTC